MRGSSLDRAAARCCCARLRPQSESRRRLFVCPPSVHQAAIPLQPYEPGSRFPNITAPTLIIAAEADDVASVSSNAFTHYNSIPNTTKKIYAEGEGKDHYFSTDRFENDFEINARHAVAFLKFYLENDTRYETYLYGAEHEAYKGMFSRYLTP